MNQTKTRSFIKSVLWRFFATLNSFVILSLAITGSNLLNAVYMNISGLIVYYVYERVWNKIKYGVIE